MPFASNIEEHDRATRTLVYGRDKSRKTFWASRAAEFGYNTILVDGDDGSSITRNLPVEAKKKLLIVDVVDTTNRNAFSMFMASFLKPNNEFLWDEQDKCSVPLATKRNPEHSYIQFDPSKLTTNDVVIIDSWTALADSTKMQFAKETGFDLTAIQREGDQFVLPNFQARMLDWILSRLHTLPCHVIVIGHEQTWEKYKGQGKDRKLVGTYTQPYSSTGPHAQKLGKHFENVLFFYKLSDTAYRVSSVGDDSTAAGSRLIPPDRYKWEDITPQTLFSAVGCKATGAECLGAKFIDKGNVVELKPSVVQTPESQPAPGPQVLNGGVMSLAQKLALKKA